MCGFIAGRFVFAPGTLNQTVSLRPAESPAPAVPEGGIETRSTASLADSIKQTLSGEDPIASARRAIPWIKSLTLDDFHAFSSHPELLRGQFGGTPSPVFSLAFCGDRVTLAD